MRLTLLFLIVVLVFVDSTYAQGRDPESTRSEHALDGTWELQVDGMEAWQEVKVPGTFEDQIAVDFDGIATYRRTIDPVAISEKRRLLLHFDAVATHAEVWFNDVRVGEHLGAWTPFRFDVTDAAMTRPDGPWELKVRVDERVGHNTQGFLPIIAPHFGGIWQSVRLLMVPNSWIDENTVLAIGDPGRQFLSVEFDWYGDELPGTVQLSVRKTGESTWSPMALVSINPQRHGSDKTRVTVSGVMDATNASGVHFETWSPENPALYDVQIKVLNARKTETLDSAVVRFACRDIRTHLDSFYLNLEPLNVRGVLNWGYSPPRTAPSLDEAFMRNEIELARSSGFNLMKFCLWVPPKRYLTLCDELGMLAWIEYPTWHPDFSPDRLKELQTEYDEFFAHDRNHPSVILRSLTCETGPSADLSVIQALYDRCHAMVPGAIVVDDSSWIAWNRIHDFYDDHPYGNNHTWVEELGKLKTYISEREPKPLMLGEAIAADTWTEPTWFEGSPAGDWTNPDSLDAARIWKDRARTYYGSDAVARLLKDSKWYAILMRKFQMEVYRREVPEGGYVVSVIRDFPKAAMGLIDYLGNSKSAPEDWSWHGDTTLLLKTPNDCRSFYGGEGTTWDFIVATPDEEIARSRRLECGLVAPDGTRVGFDPNMELKDPIGRTLGQVKTELPEVNEASLYQVFARLYDANDQILARNEWPIWILPAKATNSEKVPVELHSSANKFRELIAPVDSQINTGISILDEGNGIEGRHEKPTLLTRIVNYEVIQDLQDGRTVLLLPNNGPGSFPIEPYWFLRGGPVLSDRFGVFGDDEKPGWLAPRQMMVELQHFDLAGDVVRDIDYLDSIDPLFMLWETHDLNEVKTNGLLYRIPVGECGQLFVSALRHDGPAGRAGQFLLVRLLDGLAKNQFEAAETHDSRGITNLERLRAEVAARQWSLESLNWRFQPDPDQIGVAAQWYITDFDDSMWETIHGDKHWESQGHDTLDGWAWYRLSIDVPANWPEDQAFLTFTGVDDYYDLYINGEKVGSAGNIQKRETAFDLRTSYNIGKQVKAGMPLQITVAVYDWYGAGGIFRPVTLSTQALSEKKRILK